MGIRHYKPTTPGRRGASVSDFAEITDKSRKPEKSLLKPKPKSGGRNNQGIITRRFRGGGNKVRYRVIDFRRRRDGILATVIAIEYDPNRSSRIALIQYPDNQKAYILAPEGLKAGMVIGSGPDAEPKVGNCLPLRKIPLGMSIHNVELQPGEMRRLNSECRATVGMIGNAEHMNINLGKAGRNRWKGRKPHNRGTSMNPTDHPMGGGEGRTGGGRHPCSPTGVLAKGGKTRKKGKASNKSIVRRRRAGARGNV